MRKTKGGYVKARDRANLSAGDVVRMTCELNEMTQAELCKRAGISPPNLSDIIHGRRPLGKKIAERLSKALNVSPAYILFAGSVPREGSEAAGWTFDLRPDLLLKAIRTLSIAKKPNVEVEACRAAMREAITLIEKARKPVAAKGKQ